MCVGLAILLTTEGATPLSAPPHRGRALAMAACAIAIIAVLRLVSRFVASPLASVLSGVSAGLCHAMSAVFIKVIIEDLSAHGVAAVAVHWPVYALTASTVSGFVLGQLAVASGPLPAAVAAMSVTNPVASFLAGMLAFDAPMPRDRGVVTAIALSGVMIIAGIVGLANAAGTRDLYSGEAFGPRLSARTQSPLRMSGSVALVANPGGASQTAGTALSTCIPVAMLAAWACSAMLALPGEAGQGQEVDPHRRVALDGQCPAVLGGGPMLRVLPADRPQRLDLDAGLTLAPPDQVPALPRSGSCSEQSIEDLVVLLRGDGFDVDGDFVDVGVERVGEQPDLFDEHRFHVPEVLVDVGVDDLERLAELHVAEADVGAVVERHVGAFLQGDLVDRAAHPGERQR